MNLESLVTELKARGLDYLSTSRCQQYLNDSYLVDICETENWPFLHATKEGTAPLTVSDLRSVESVINSTQDNKLAPLDPRELTSVYDTDLTTTGSPGFYYVDAETVVSVYPANTSDTILVRYWKVPEALSGSASPVLPARFHTLIVDYAVARAYEDSDDYELAQNARENADGRLAKMRESLLGWNRDLPSEYVAMVDPGTSA
jgi:hypothetical protein